SRAGLPGSGSRPHGPRAPRARGGAARAGGRPPGPGGCARQAVAVRRGAPGARQRLDGPVLAGAARSGYAGARAEVAELADAEDSKSSAREGVGGRLPSSAVRIQPLTIMRPPVSAPPRALWQGRAHAPPPT